MACGGISRGFVNSLWILFPSLAMTISLAAVTGYALALWNVKWANGLLFVLFVCAFVPFQIIMYPLIVMAAPASPSLVVLKPASASTGHSKSPSSTPSCRCRSSRSSSAILQGHTE